MPNDLQEAFKKIDILDFGITIKRNKFKFGKVHCVLPEAMVIAYALAVASSGQANKIYMAGFDGYPIGDIRNHETNKLLQMYLDTEDFVEIVSITPTVYKIEKSSIFGSFE